MKKYIFVTLIAITILSNCKPNSDKTSAVVAQQNDSVVDLTNKYCGSCHQYPAPDLLDKSTWQNAVLPRKGNRLGIYSNSTERAERIESKAVEHLFPAEPIIALDDWEKIKAFYLSNAPDSLTLDKVEPTVGLEHFKVKTPEFKIAIPSTTLAKFMDDKTIFLGDAISKKFIQFDNRLDFIKAGNIIEGAVNLEEINNEYWILSMGSFSPTDQASGMLINISKKENKKALIIADKLRRPVYASYGDLNNDGKIDIVISEFAKWTGRVTILYSKGGYEFEQSTLINQTGAVKTFLHDFNKDGLLDVIALFAQGKEGISIFYNQGDNNFSREEVLEFSPSHGSSSFELIDFDRDGDLDILYTAGDNADFIPILKPYHGIYLFENDGNNNFKEKFFYHLNGAYAAKMEDFDLDNDLDIAAISFFPDYANQASESFVYLKNKGEFNFEASTFENNTRGRWIVMDTADKDNDGDIDIILGSLAFETVPDNGFVKKWLDNQLPFVVLENQVRK